VLEHYQTRTNGNGETHETTRDVMRMPSPAASILGAE
jgi:hypothetical protein